MGQQPALELDGEKRTSSAETPKTRDEGYVIGHDDEFKLKSHLNTNSRIYMSN